MTTINDIKSYIYVYELPYSDRQALCHVLDFNYKWRELGGKFMKFDMQTLFKIESEAPIRHNSPTDELLTLWGEQNHTIIELYKMLSKMKHFQAMTILKRFVDSKYHIPQDLIISDRNGHDAAPSCAENCTPLIVYAELEKCTDTWNKSNILGIGGFGVVFKGKWKNTDVAIKRLECQKGAEQQLNIPKAKREPLLLRELECLVSYRHDNILSLYGFSIDGDKPCLVYQYMVNGSLEDRLQCLQGTSPLNWNLRCKIATGSARGLQFLHGLDEPVTKPSLIHGDIKSANILLDQHFEPRIGDFGLAREGPLRVFTNLTVSHVQGTRPYLPDEFLRSKKLSTKVDTYSFGVVLFEIASGLRAYDNSREHKLLKDHVVNYTRSISELADAKAGLDGNNVFSSLISIGKECVSYKAKDRPEMEQVLQKLNCIQE